MLVLFTFNSAGGGRRLHRNRCAISGDLRSLAGLRPAVEPPASLPQNKSVSYMKKPASLLMQARYDRMLFFSFLPIVSTGPDVRRLL